MCETSMLPGSGTLHPESRVLGAGGCQRIRGVAQAAAGLRLSAADAQGLVCSL